MCTYEILKLLETHNHSLPASLYIEIIQSSPQIDHTKYNSYENYYESWDTNGEYLRYSVYLN